MKTNITISLDVEVVKRLRKSGKNISAKIEQLLKKELGMVK